MDINDEFKILLDGQIIFSLLFYPKEDRTYCCFEGNFNSCDNNYVSWPEIIDHFNPSHTSNNFKLEFFIRFNEPRTEEGVLLKNLRIYINECHQSCKKCNGP